MNKLQCRKYIKEKLNFISEQRRKDAAFKLLNKFSNFKNKSILSFASMGNEINLWPLNQELIISNNLFLPKVCKGELKVFQIKNLNHLKKSSLGILEPDAAICTIGSLTQIDIVLVPGLAFDAKNNRLGYGMGFYDKLLNNFQGYRIGLCFKEQSLKSIPTEPHDQKVDELFSF